MMALKNTFHFNHKKKQTKFYFELFIPRTTRKNLHVTLVNLHLAQVKSLPRTKSTF